jgi:serine/threonine protein kinase
VIGQTISHYKITSKLGEGGMGVVYKAEDTKLKRPVALKFITENLIRDAEARKRFEREATAAAGVSHANVCHIYEIADAEGHAFLAMEFIEGESLDRRIERGPLPLKDALDFARQTAEGLTAAHANGVVHRDIKPANLLITPGGQVKILDFGLALLTEGSKLTRLDTRVGTVAYMSPEQAQGMEVDRRGDVWALGCVLYEMVCGQRPFRGVYDQALLYEIINQEPEPLTGLRTGVPMELEFIVGKCLDKDPGNRYQHASDIAVDLRSLGDKLRSGRSAVLRNAAAPVASGPHPLSRYRVIEERQSGPDSVVYEAEDTELRRTVAVRVLPPEAAREVEHRVQAFPRMKLALAATTAMLALMAGAALWLLFSGPRPSSTPLRKFSFTPAGLVTFWRAAVISPNGKHIV